MSEIRAQWEKRSWAVPAAETDEDEDGDKAHGESGRERS
jgi:hypothetical protein